jgi:hypothetical protein
MNPRGSSFEKRQALPNIARRIDMISVRTADPETRSEIAGIRAELKNAPAPRPQIVYDHSAERRNRGDANLYTHLWFRNEPSGRVARDVVARITWNSETGKGLFAVDAKWQEVLYNLGPAIYAANRIDFPSDGTKHALDLCIREPDAAEFYALDIESPNRGAFAQDRQLQTGIYSAFVELSCEGYSGSFRFRVQKDGNEPPQVTLIDSY